MPDPPILRTVEMREVGLYVGAKTAMAATARGEAIKRQMGSGPLGWMSAVACVLAGRVPEGIVKGDPGAEPWSRGFLRGLGYDPDTHTLSRKGSALVVRDFKGEPVRAFSEKKLKALRYDRRFLAGFAQEEPTEPEPVPSEPADPLPAEPTP